MESRTKDNNIFKQIKEGKIKMRPRWHFVFNLIGWIILGTMIVFSLIYLLSFFFFSTQTSGLWYLPGFGSLGWKSFFNSLPWVLLAVVLIFMFALEALVRKSSFGWRRSFVYVFLLIFVLMSLFSWILSQSSFHQDLYWQAQEAGSSLMAPLYLRQGRIDFDNIYRGEIIEVGEDLVLLTEDGESISFVYDAELLASPEIKVGRRVIVAAQEEGGQMRAWRIKGFRGGFFNGRNGRHRNFEINSRSSLY